MINIFNHRWSVFYIGSDIQIKYDNFFKKYTLNEINQRYFVEFEEFQRSIIEKMENILVDGVDRYCNR